MTGREPVAAVVVAGVVAVANSVAAWAEFTAVLARFTAAMVGGEPSTPEPEILYVWASEDPWDEFDEVTGR